MMKNLAYPTSHWYHKDAIKMTSCRRLSLSPQVAITKYHRMSGLSNRNLFLMIVEARKSKIRVLGWLAPGEDSLPGLQIDGHLIVTSHGRERDLSLLF